MNDSTLFAEEPSQTPMTETTSAPVAASDKAPAVKPNSPHTTVALSILVHGEAVRFNRGKTRGNDFDFKYMKGTRPGEVYPYVSSQCFKRYWRESLPTVPSPIIKVEGKNQAFTSGNPFNYVDDDLFGYMIAGAEAEEEAAEANDEEEKIEGVDAVDAALESLLFSPDNIKDSGKLLARFQDESKLAMYLQKHMDPESSGVFRETPKGGEPNEDLVRLLINSLNAAIKDLSLIASAEIQLKGRDKKKQEAILKSGDAKEVATLNRALLLRDLKNEIQETPKELRPVTRRTAPVRMHALVAFSGVKTALDFQTFSRYVAASGLDSTLVPNNVGIYSGWLKARILIEASRIGKFYVGPKNLDLYPDQVEGRKVEEEVNLYDPRKGKVAFVQMGVEARQARLKQVLEALANVGNNQGPASGALHDGSLKPKAFIGAVMKCADSPFDSVWQGTNDQPRLDLLRLEAVLEDWEDLFLDKAVYIGLPVETMSEENDGQLKTDIENRLEKLGYRAVVGSPRKTLLQFADEAAKLAVPTS